MLKITRLRCRPLSAHDNISIFARFEIFLLHEVVAELDGIFLAEMSYGHYNLWESLTPLIRYNRCVGMWCISQTYRQSPKHALVTTFYILLNIIAISGNFKERLYFEESQQSFIVKYLHKSYFYILFISTVIFYIIPHISRCRIVKAMQHVDEADSIFENLGMGLDLYKVNSKVSRMTSIFLASMLAIYISAVYLAHWSPFQVQDELPTTLVLAYAGSYLVHVAIITQYIAFASALKQRFFLLNKMLQSMAKSSKQFVLNSYPVNETFFKERINHVLKIHNNLLQASRLMNQSNTIQLFMRICIDFIASLGYCYMIVYVVLFTSTTKVLVNAATELTLAVLELLLIVHCSSSLCYQVRKKKNTHQYH